MRSPLFLMTSFALTIPVSIALSAPPTVVEVPRGDPAKWLEVRAPKGRILRLSAEPASKWLLVDEERADLFPCDAGKFADFASDEAGRYKVIVTSPEGTSARVVIVVGDGGPMPPGPLPPVDLLADRLKAAYDADPEKILLKRQSHAKDLASVYRLVARSAGDPTFSTAGEFIAFARKSAAEMVDTAKGPRCLSGVRDEVSRELGAIFPADGPLSDDQRKRSAAMFLHLATILEAF